MRLWTILAVGALAVPSPLHAQSSGFSVDFSWEGTAACFDPKSPPFSLNGVPAGTKRLAFAMKDLDAPGFPHGGGTVAFSGQTQVGRDAFLYKGPCPPSGQHTYQWTVEAQDQAGKTLATATVAKKFPPR
ncbi:MAG TPA: YbhB/YbcL family Raf kinase inhibitor-like protein [Stellaceae bacterium]|nr:YbhB/YbcL family Raf kinase inhibitor-like protein [Stellaceae bacterium]